MSAPNDFVGRADNFNAFNVSIPETAIPSISWSIKEHKMVEESRKNKIGFHRFSDRMRHMEQILNDVPPIAKEIERAYFPRLFGTSLWANFPAGQVVTLSDLNLGEWVTATSAGTVTATASGSPDRVIGRVMETNMEITPEGTNTTARIQLRR